MPGVSRVERDALRPDCDRIECAEHELRLVGGSYGQAIIAGVGTAAEVAINAVVDRTRIRGRQPRIYVQFEFDDDPAPQLEVRHAGREGTPEAGVGTALQPFAGGDESVAETRAG